MLSGKEFDYGRGAIRPRQGNIAKKPAYGKLETSIPWPILMGLAAILQIAATLKHKQGVTQFQAMCDSASSRSRFRILNVRRLLELEAALKLPRTMN